MSAGSPKGSVLARSPPAQGVRYGLGRPGRCGQPVENSFRLFAFLAPNRALRATGNPRIDGPIPSLATISSLLIPNQSRAAFAILPVPIVVVLRHRRIPVPCWVDPSRGADKVEHAGSGGGDLLGHFGGCGVIENCLPRPVDGQERPVSKNRILCVRVIRSLRVRVTRP